MTFLGWLTIILFAVILTALAMPLGSYMARVYQGERVFLTPIFAGPERLLYRIFRTDPERGQDWKQYAKSLIIFSLAGWLLLYFILRTQTLWDWTGLNPQGFKSAPWNVTFNTTSSFLTNTNWQFYGGETTMSYFSQMVGLTVQNWLSAGVGICVAVALIRGIVSRSGKSIGNFWADLVRTVLYVMTPICVIGALVLVSQGVIQNFSHYLTAHTVTGLTQSLAMGPVASQEVIKELGTNGGGFFNVNSSHPFENPNGFTNLFEMLLVLIIPAALVFAYGRMTGNRRQGYAIYGVMMFMFLGAVIVAYIAEAHGSPAQHHVGLHTHAIAGSAGGNMEGKEQRFGIAGSALFDVITTATSCGAVNSAIESYTGIGGAVPMANLSRLRGDLRRRGHRSLLDPPVRPAGRVHRRSDGRAHPGVARQEARGKGDQARRIGDPDHAAGGAAVHGHRRRHQGRALLDRRSRHLERGRTRAAGVLRDLLRLSLPGQQQRLRVRRLHRLHPAESGQRRRARCHARQPARRLRHARSPATRRSCSRSPWRAPWRASAHARRAWGRCAPTTPRSPCC